MKQEFMFLIVRRRNPAITGKNGFPGTNVFGIIQPKVLKFTGRFLIGGSRYLGLIRKTVSTPFPKNLITIDDLFCLMPGRLRAVKA